MKNLFKILLLISFTASLYAFDKYSLPCKKDLLDSSLDTALSQVGIIEGDGNTGEVEKYAKNINLPKGSPYCAAGVFYCFDKAASDNSDIPIPKTGVATSIFNFAKKYGTYTKAVPEKHDLIVWRLPRSWQGHVERIFDVEKAGWVKTIAFNSKKANLEGVFIQRRNLYHILGRLKVLGLVGFSTEVDK